MVLWEVDLRLALPLQSWRGPWEGRHVATPVGFLKIRVGGGRKKTVIKTEIEESCGM